MSWISVDLDINDIINEISFSDIEYHFKDEIRDSAFELFQADEDFRKKCLDDLDENEIRDLADELGKS